jgi:hypothetical protein
LLPSEEIEAAKEDLIFFNSCMLSDRIATYCGKDVKNVVRLQKRSARKIEESLIKSKEITKKENSVSTHLYNKVSRNSPSTLSSSSPQAPSNTVKNIEGCVRLAQVYSLILIS